MVEVNGSQYAGYMGMQAVGDYVFLAYIYGEVHVFDINTGKLVKILNVGPEARGGTAWAGCRHGIARFQAQGWRISHLHREQRLCRQEQLLPLEALTQIT